MTRRKLSKLNPAQLKKPLLNVVRKTEIAAATKINFCMSTPAYHIIIPILIGGLFISLFFIRLFYPVSSLFMIPDFGESDVLHLNLPLKVILSDAYQNGQWPLWNPLVANGFPLLAEGQIGTFYLPNLLLFRFLPLVIAYNLSLVLVYISLAGGTYLFGRNLGFSVISASFAAFIFTFSGFFSVHLNHLNFLQTVSLTPFLFYGFLRLWKKPSLKWTILISFLISQQIFAGYLTILYVSLVGIGIFLILYSFLTHISWRDSLKRFLFVLIGLTAAAGLAAIQLLPTYELWKMSSRAEGLDYSTVTSFPYPPKHLLAFINPYIFGNPATGTYPAFDSNWGIFWENTAYIGIFPLLLILISLFLHKKKIVKLHLLFLFITLLLVLGKYSPLYFLYSLPPFSLFRVPSRYLLLTVWSATMLSSFALEWVLKSVSKLTHRYTYVVIAVFSVVIAFIITLDEYRFSYAYPPISDANWWYQTPETAKLISSFNQPKITSIGVSQLWNSVFLKKGWQDIAAYRYFTNSLYPDQNVLFSIAHMDINTGGLIPRRIALTSQLAKDLLIDMDLQTASMSSLAKNVLSLSSVSFFISAYPLEAANVSLIAKVAPPSQTTFPAYLLYQNQTPKPRVYMAYKTKTIETAEQAVLELGKEDFLAQNVVLTESDLESSRLGKLDPASKAHVEFSSNDEVVVKVETSSDGLLVLTDSFYPGWRAYIDGAVTPIYQVNISQRGVIIPAGIHTVRFFYQPQSFVIGKGITLVSMIIVSLMAFSCSVLSVHTSSGNTPPLPHPSNRRHN